MRHLFAAIAFVIVFISWIAAIAVGAAVEYLGWHTVIADNEIVSGIAIAFLAAPAALMATQTVFGLLAAPFAMLAERFAPQPPLYLE